MREMRKIYRNLNGIRNMSKLPGAVVAIDVNREINALREARNLGIPTICLIDTDGDPDMVDIPIPGNDDSMRSIDVIMRELCAAVIEGRTQRPQKDDSKADGEKSNSGPGASGRRRSSRSQFQAEAPPESASPTPEPEAVPAATEPAAGSDG